jgi:hypothetical protein
MSGMSAADVLPNLHLPSRKNLQTSLPRLLLLRYMLAELEDEYYLSIALASLVEGSRCDSRVSSCRCTMAYKSKRHFGATSVFESRQDGASYYVRVVAF